MLDLKEASESDKSKIFFCLSAVFANISHSNVFNGIPDASKTLKRYAFALLAKAHSLDESMGNDSNLLIVFYVQIMPDDLVMQLHRF